MQIKLHMAIRDIILGKDKMEKQLLPAGDFMITAISTIYSKILLKNPARIHQSILKQVKYFPLKKGIKGDFKNMGLLIVYEISSTPLFQRGVFLP